MDTKVVDFLNNHFELAEVSKISAFLRDFSQNGQITVASIFVFAQEAKKSVDEVLALCEKENQRNWYYQHPDIRGDVDALGGAGLQNRLSLENIYGALGIKSPAARRTKVPDEAFVVITKNSAYRLGKADSNGERSVSRDARHLKFTKCKVIDLMAGDSMQLQCLDGPYCYWHTSTVDSIE